MWLITDLKSKYSWIWKNISTEIKIRILAKFYEATCEGGLIFVKLLGFNLVVGTQFNFFVDFFFFFFFFWEKSISEICFDWLFSHKIFIYLFYLSVFNILAFNVMTLSMTFGMTRDLNRRCNTLFMAGMGRN